MGSGTEAPNHGASPPGGRGKRPTVPKRWTMGMGRGILGAETGRGGETMEVEVKLEPGRKELKAVLYAGADTPELRELADRLAGVFLGPGAAFRAGETVFLEPGEVLRFYTDGKGVSAQTAEGVYSVRLRLYELEERLASRGFLRVSHSELVNRRKITALDLSLAGTIRMTLDHGKAVCYVSRRYVRKIKERLLGEEEVP